MAADVTQVLREYLQENSQLQEDNSSQESLEEFEDMDLDELEGASWGGVEVQLFDIIYFRNRVQALFFAFSFLLAMFLFPHSHTSSGWCCDSSTAQSAVKTVGDGVKGAAKMAGNAVKGTVDMAGKAVKGTVDMAGKAVKGGVKMAGDAVKGGAKMVGKAVKGGKKGAGKVKDAVMGKSKDKEKGKEKEKGKDDEKGMLLDLEGDVFDEDGSCSPFFPFPPAPLRLWCWLNWRICSLPFCNLSTMWSERLRLWWCFGMQSTLSRSWRWMRLMEKPSRRRTRMMMMGKWMRLMKRRRMRRQMIPSDSLLGLHVFFRVVPSLPQRNEVLLSFHIISLAVPSFLRGHPLESRERMVRLLQPPSISSP